MNPAWISSAVAVANLVGTAAVALWVWLDRRNRATVDRVDQVEGRQAATDRRLDVVETRMDLTPAHDDLGRVYGRLEAINANLQELGGEVNGLVRQVAMLNQHLLDKGK